MRKQLLIHLNADMLNDQETIVLCLFDNLRVIRVQVEKNALQMLIDINRQPFANALSKAHFSRHQFFRLRVFDAKVLFVERLKLFSKRLRVFN